MMSARPESRPAVLCWCFCLLSRVRSRNQFYPKPKRTLIPLSWNSNFYALLRLPIQKIFYLHHSLSTAQDKHFFATFSNPHNGSRICTLLIYRTTALLVSPACPLRARR